MKAWEFFKCECSSPVVPHTEDIACPRCRKWFSAAAVIARIERERQRRWGDTSLERAVRAYDRLKRHLLRCAGRWPRVIPLRATEFFLCPDCGYPFYNVPHLGVAPCPYCGRPIKKITVLARIKRELAVRWGRKSARPERVYRAYARLERRAIQALE